MPQKRTNEQESKAFIPYSISQPLQEFIRVLILIPSNFLLQHKMAYLFSHTEHKATAFSIFLSAFFFGLLCVRHDDRIRIEPLQEEIFEYSTCLQSLCQLYEGNEARIRLLAELPHSVISCLGASLHYLKEFRLERILRNARLDQLSFIYRSFFGLWELSYDKVGCF